MKKILFAFLTVGLLFSASSCKKCGYCEYPNGSTDASVCKDNSLGPISGSLDGYEEAQSECDRNGGKWVNSK